jgi:hypothetical protein
MKSLTFTLLGALLLPPALSAQIAEPEAEVLYTLSGEQAGDNFGFVAENLGDIDGDGAGDFIVGAPNRFSPMFPFPIGKVYVYSGADGSELFSTESLFGTRAGFSVAGLGDVTGDGVPDYVYSELPVVVMRSGADHSILQVWFRSLENFGSDVNRAGDLDGDGYDDVLIGAPAAGSGAFHGRVYAFSSATGELIWQVDGNVDFALLGEGVGPVGDVNADGVPDVAAAAPGAGKKERGEAYVLSGVDGSMLHTLEPVGLPAVTARGIGTFGQFHTAGGGDYDGDGIGDVYVGDYAAARGQANPRNPGPILRTGRVYVFSGATGERLLVLDAENNGDGLGPGRLVPDMNGDGLADIYTAAYTFGDDNVGKGYLLASPGPEIAATHTGTVAGDSLGVDATYVEDVNMDGHQDYLLTGFGVLHVISGALP